ncbi:MULTISPECIES: hypothetical protein [unclassified Mesorhizobium]|uniref:hypothetical protein n=1 Tax=unclassified Mesorhizobium TaxID=325217 RepID=UPI001CCC1E3A|nr:MULTISPECIES: hypothetical protein [unclassified Mesorhizobium]MBZ9684288.1 hypothetical protein [Mesorhizobium sp. CO1-1-2]MBZ9698690.1 hypothetical protein [Mesorhizobium sp. CO1-1-9]MBZ9727564.1 hypothetical protein [Mesorhizobium sp. CO1-1-11]MBZ9923717.1 hypothetical protein [Mesorhizobium sp. BR1-1-4]
MFYPGRFLEPNDIEMLARVAETISNERGVASKSPQRERLAAHLLKLFMNGLAG